MEIGRFDILARDPGSAARRGRLHTAHGAVETPAFMPVGTQGSVKTMSPDELSGMGCRLLLGNTYHLWQRPGAGIVRRAGGLHRFMAWPHALLTDSGGYQVFSLARLRKITPEGIVFRSHLDGARCFLGPSEAMALQRDLGADIAMVLDDCPPWPCGRDYACQSLQRTLRWAADCARAERAPGQMLFGIVQGGGFADLRVECAARLAEIGFDGYAIGGVSVGEPPAEQARVVGETAPRLPEDRPRYLMGVGILEQMVSAVAQGVDLFDCVWPTRLARNGTALTRRGRLPVKAGRFKDDERPIEEGCGCYACTRFSRAYVRHLLNVNEILGLRLMTWHNLHVTLTFMEDLRSALEQGVFQAFRETWGGRAAPSLTETIPPEDGRAAERKT